VPFASDCVSLIAAVSLDPVSGDAHQALGLALAQRGRLEEANNELFVLKSLDPTLAADLAQWIRMLEPCSPVV
jgi:Flp pilus assembly protein TadD